MKKNTTTMVLAAIFGLALAAGCSSKPSKTDTQQAGTVSTQTPAASNANLGASSAGRSR